LSWLVVLTTVPWNLHFAARRAAQEMVVSRERGIAVRVGYGEEAGRISRRMLWFALGAHLGTALAAAAIAFFAKSEAGYYVAGISLLSTAFRPAAAYFAHVRERINVLARESTHPRDDVAALLQRAEVIEESVNELRIHLASADEDLRRTESALADGIAHARTPYD
jgi:UTP:GlnB (protein PII) uridylyltransferase